MKSGTMRRRPGRPAVTAPDDIDVRALRLSIRAGAAATQQGFAGLLGVPLRTLQAWEQGRRRPSGAARVLLAMIANHPFLAWDALHGELPRRLRK